MIIVGSEVKVVEMASNNVCSVFESRACRRMSMLKIVSMPAPYDASRNCR